MGKKSKRPARSGASHAPASVHILHNKTLCKLVDELWERTKALEGISTQYLWGEFDAVSHYTKQIGEKQGPTPAPLPDRRAALPVMEKWLSEHGAKYEAVEIAEFPDVGYGLRTKRDIKKEEKVITIPRQLMMTLTTAREGPLGDLIGRDHMLQVMPSVTLALHLLNEHYNPNSFWKPYIDALPHDYNTPFYFQRDDLKEFQSSPCLVKAIIQIRNVSKVYAHLHRVIRTTCDPSLHLYEAGFYFSDFVWAISAVMSRQNEIPERGDGSESILALIPLWDLCNHTEGHLTTFYNLEEKSCDCYALDDTPTGVEFRIYYGSRANNDLVIHQGFAYMGNKSDMLLIRLGLSASDPHHDNRKIILEKLKISVSGEFSIYAMECPFSQNLVAFTRVFTATSEELERLVALDHKQLAEIMFSDRWSGDRRVLDFLQTRCLILTRSYPTTLEQDTALLDKLHTLSPQVQQAVKVRICEKRILKNAIEYARTIIEELDKKMEGRVVSAAVSTVGGGGGMLLSMGTTAASTEAGREQTGTSGGGASSVEQCIEETGVGSSSLTGVSEKGTGSQAGVIEQESGSQTGGEKVMREVTTEGTVGVEELVISEKASKQI